ncbi:MAG: ClbS/DfsB family four-helix bundle protein [Anaerolineae bacterium]|nr:MAG: ClbS/DfsB family four-helix bundle protein [Anaerolineae bacterium]
MTDIKTRLLNQIHTARAELDAALAALTPEQMEARTAPDAWSAKDTLAHIGLWEQMLVQFQLPGLRPEEPYVVAGVTITEYDVDDMNAQFRAAWRDRPLAEVRAFYERSHQETLAAIQACSDARLTEKGRYPDEPDDYPVVNIILSETVEHYEEHIDHVRAAAR